MPAYYEIVVNIPRVRGVFHYHADDELASLLSPGHLVEVPFGRQNVQGVVLRQVQTPDVPETRPIQNLIDSQPVLTPAQLELAQQMADATLSPLAAMVELMIPPGLSQQADVLYDIHPRQGQSVNEIIADNAQSPTQNRLLKLLQKRGTLRGRQIDRAIPHQDWRPAASSLVRRGVLTSQPVLQSPSVKAKQVRTAQLACSREQLQASLGNLGRGAAGERRDAILRFLVREDAPVNVSWVYAETGGNSADLRYLEQRGLVLLGADEIWRDPLGDSDYGLSQPHTLTADQQILWQEIYQEIQDPLVDGSPRRPFLLHGVTGSGKTEIYLHAIAETLARGKQAIFLVPEIALTPQTIRRVVSRFPGKVGVLHSQLSSGERYDTWRRIRDGILSVVVGPRSALFAPFSHIGLIVLDEFHDSSYYQSDPPFYHARQSAEYYAHLCGAVCILGSATPDVVSRSRKDLKYLHLPERIFTSGPGAQTTELPPVSVVDMRQELRAGNTSIFSRPLQLALAQVLEKKQQAILFLNRRGTATYIFCRDCGYTLKCPRCEMPLTLHLGDRGPSSRGALICHYCHYQRRQPETCPQCGGRKIRNYGTGTEKVEADVKALFPKARTLRWDYETTRQKGAHDKILAQFASQRADILIGTQMIAKGLDLPFVTLVGIILADVGLSLPDPLAAERSFQVLTQVAGRAGRSSLGGVVIMQSFQPDHYVIQAAAQHDYNAFYQREMAYRKEIGYPPFSRLARLEIRTRTSAEGESVAAKIAEQLRTQIAARKHRNAEIIGPVPCFFSRLSGVYRWQVILRAADPAVILKDINLTDWRVEVDPLSLL